MAFPDELQDGIERGEIVIPKHRSTSFLEKNQGAEGEGFEMGSLKYADTETVSMRLRQLSYMCAEWEQESPSNGKELPPPPDIYEDDMGAPSDDFEVDYSIAKHLFINADPETEHQHVAAAMNLSAANGIWCFTLGTVKVDGKILPLVAIRPALADYDASSRDNDSPPENRKKFIEIYIGRSQGKDCMVVNGRRVSLAEIDLILKNAPVPPQNIRVVVVCTLDSRHRALIALLSVCAKHGISGAAVFSM